MPSLTDDWALDLFGTLAQAKEVFLHRSLTEKLIGRRTNLWRAKKGSYWHIQGYLRRPLKVNFTFKGAFFVPFFCFAKVEFIAGLDKLLILEVWSSVTGILKAAKLTTNIGKWFVKNLCSPKNFRSPQGPFCNYPEKANFPQSKLRQTYFMLLFDWYNPTVSPKD